MKDNLNISLRKRIMNFQHDKIEIIKSKQAHKYKYAPLDVIIPIILPKLKEHGIGFEHITGYDQQVSRSYLQTILYNVDNEKDELISVTYIDEEAKLATMNKFMVIGAGMTYFRRYHLALMLGLLTDEDTDAGGMESSPRSVDASTRTAEVDYIAIFKNQIGKGKTKKQMEVIFKTHKPNIDDKVAAEIIDLIDKLK